MVFIFTSLYVSKEFYIIFLLSLQDKRKRVAVKGGEGIRPVPIVATLLKAFVLIFPGHGA